MNNLDIKDFYVVYGSSDCSVPIYPGILLGIFEDENMASANASGRGKVHKQKGIKVNDEAYLFELDFPVQLNKILRKDPEYVKSEFGIVVTHIYSPIDFMRVMRRRTGISLKEAKDLLDEVREKRMCKIKNMHSNLDCVVSKEEFIDWKQELLGFAEIEAI